MSKSAAHHALLGCPAPTKSRWRRYWELMRLHKPVLGNTLMFWPCAWGLTMAGYTTGTSSYDLVMQLLAFAVGSTLMHSAACVLNDICDIDFDKQVERTRSRPLPSGVVTVTEAWILLLALMVPTVAMLLLTNQTAALVALPGIFPFHALYPLMKRWTYWPQAWLGFAMNWGFLVSWLAVTDTVPVFVVWPFFLGTVCWTIVYDTIYACQDREDDVHAGVKSTALLFGAWVRPILAGFTLAFLALLAGAGLANGQGAPYFVLSCGGAAAHFAWQFASWAPDVPADGGRKFNSNGLTGLIIWSGMLVDYWRMQSATA
ncbi:4-hydroxybenzoate octaprenyltransferase [Phanerochaete sordida]|uniref:4-hydroxybenzoate polyprenyltransferase, mitochondrial n=1 Tax=Phanerochaete sordida TaxID=48140 RepID=A0A9P3L7U9_9APHY|nr:4-hydroxybenzoate octaprenyltransferase [Phanerochaete sordida]